MTEVEMVKVKEILSQCVREELRDHAFGDAEVSWQLMGEEVASGYYGSGTSSVTLWHPKGEEFLTLKGMDAKALRYCGTQGTIERNDETGPATYDEGTCMPALTHKGVLEELTRKP